MYPSDLRPAYSKGWDIFTHVGSLNPFWNEPETSRDLDNRFQQAVTVVGDAFRLALSEYLHSWLPARTIIREAIADSSAPERILLLPVSVPWREHLFALEADLSLIGHYLYVLYPDADGNRDALPEGPWRIQAVPVAVEAFELRRSLPTGWLGLRDGELDAAIGSGSEGAVFVHRNGFVGGHRSLQGALLMARLALVD